MSKVGRNQSCPCGSGKKYKRCHGVVPNSMDSPIPSHILKKVIQRKEALELQRQQQQGLGNQIISAEVNGTRFMAVNDRLMHSNSWRTFIDFLGDYIKLRIGGDWGNNEIHNKSD